MRKYSVAAGLFNLPFQVRNTLVFSGFFRSMAVFSLRFSRRGHEILCGGSDRCLHIFDLESMSRVGYFNPVYFVFNSVNVSACK